jgi:hypothetical protein
MQLHIWWWSLIGLMSVASVAIGAAPIGYQAVPRDAFPVFDNPTMLTAEAAEKDDSIYDRDPVIGVYHNGEAKAYPITVMGVHELGNDTIGGVPIAVSW